MDQSALAADVGLMVDIVSLHQVVFRPPWPAGSPSPATERPARRIKDPGRSLDRSKPRPINIKSEGILDRPAYRRLLALKRCIIVGEGFYEWLKQPGQSNQPYWIGLRGGEMFGFAGLWDAVKDGDEWLVSCAILTTSPNPLVATLHNRQPVILTPEQEELWLSADTTDAGELLPLLTPLPETLMTMYPVPSLMNDVNNEGPELRRRVDEEPRQTALL